MLDPSIPPASVLKVPTLDVDLAALVVDLAPGDAFATGIDVIA